MMTESKFKIKYPNTYKYYKSYDGLLKFSTHQEFFEWKGWKVIMIYDIVNKTPKNINYLLHIGAWLAPSYFVSIASPKNKHYESIEEAQDEGWQILHERMEGITETIIKGRSDI